ILLDALGLAVAVPLAYLWIIFFLDTSVHLPTGGRALASLGLLGGIAWAARHFWSRWRRLDFTEDQVALAIEGRTPVRMQNRLINAVQLARQTSEVCKTSEVSGLTDAVVRENCNRLR